MPGTLGQFQPTARLVQLAQKSMASRSQADQAEATYDALLADIDSLRATIARREIRAPFSGITGIRQVNLGQYLQPGAEVVRLEFDPSQISYRDLLVIFFTIHDPTTLNRQGNDVGTQYRSVIFYQNDEQEATARQVIAEMAHVWDAPIVTELAPAAPFYKAEDYHQNYFAQHPLQGYCAFVVAPKVAKFRKMYADKLKT